MAVAAQPVRVWVRREPDGTVLYRLALYPNQYMDLSRLPPGRQWIRQTTITQAEWDVITTLGEPITGGPPDWWAVRPDGRGQT